MIVRDTFTASGQVGMIGRALAGTSVSAELPDGCVLRFLPDGGVWEPAAANFVAPCDGSARIDCVTHAGTPVTSILEIA